jgi:predicted secreted protein
MSRSPVRATAIACAMLAAGCSSIPASYDWSDLRADPREFYNLNAPIVVRGADLDGQRVTLKRGQALVVKLDAGVDAGPRWEMQRYDGPTVIAPVRHDLVAQHAAEATAPARTGDATFRVRGVAAGTQPVVIEYKGAFEAAAAKTIRFDVVVP